MSYPITGDDYDGLWSFLNWENYEKEPLIIIIVHHAINQIIVQKMSEPWLQGMTMMDYDRFSIEKIMEKNHWLLS